MVAGVSARLKLDEGYRSFFELVATEIATAVTKARAYEEERKRAEALAELDRAKTVFFPTSAMNFAPRSRSCWARSRSSGPRLKWNPKRGNTSRARTVMHLDC